MPPTVILAFTGVFLIASLGRQDNPTKVSDQLQTAKPSPIETEFKSIKREADAKLNKLYGDISKEYDAAKTEEAREAVKKRATEKAVKIYRPAVEKMMPLIRQNPADPGSVDALVWIVNSRGGANVDMEAAEYLKKHHLTRKQTIELAYRHKRAPMAWTEPLLRAQLAAPDLPAGERPRVLLSLAMLKQTYSQMPELLAHLTDDQVAQMSDVYGKDTLATFRKIDATKEEAEAVKLYTELAEKYASVKLAGNFTMGGIAKSALFEIQHLSVGKAAPDIVAEDTDGVKFKLSDYKGSVVVLSFWGTWCGPCMALVPHEREIVDRLKGKKLALIGVNSDTDKKKLKSAMERENITWRSFWCGEKGLEGEIPAAWNVTGWPTIYVLDHKGVIRAKNAMGKALDQVVDGLMAKAEQEK